MTTPPPTAGGPPAGTGPAGGEPARTESAGAEPSGATAGAELAGAGPAGTELAGTELAGGESAGGESAGTGPPGTGPPGTGPAGAEIAGTEPAGGGPAGAEPAGVGADRLLLVTYSPRLPAGVLSWPAWQALRAGPVYAADSDSPQAVAVQATGIAVRRLPAGAAAGGPSEMDDPSAARALRELARGGATVVWLTGPAGDSGLARALGDLVAREAVGAAEVEVVYGSWDPPGARLLDVVAVMDRLRSPGGCPWDAEQTHASLAPYLLEEAYEMLDAIADGDLGLLREELGDVLLQVAFHARLAEELPEPDRWSVDDVAADLVDKLVRRHPHVFGDRTVAGAAEVEANWEVIKAAEKGRSSLTEGVPLGQPALSLAAKLQRRVAKAALRVDPPAGTGVGERLFALVAEARAAGVDPEAALRAVARDYLDAIRVAEAAAAVEAEPADHDDLDG